VSFRVLNWRITVGLSLWSLGFNLLYFWLVSHRLRDTLVLSASSLFVLGAAHLAHSVQK
jgi:hypothetical protein